MLLGNLLSLLAVGGSTAFASLAVRADNATALPLNYGVVLYPAFQTMDVFGPLDILQLMAFNYSIKSYMIAETLDPVTNKAITAKGDFGQQVIPTHTFANPPEDLEVLIVPGGPGSRAPPANFTSMNDFLLDVYPKLKYLIVICTGNALVARTGLLDGKNATGNKRSWAWMTAQGPNVNWVPHARWVRDGNIYTVSGVSSALDGFYGFVSDIFGEAQADNLAISAEYVRQKDSTWDEFAEYYGLVGNTTAPGLSSAVPSSTGLPSASVPLPSASGPLADPTISAKPTKSKKPKPTRSKKPVRPARPA